MLLTSTVTLAVLVALFFAFWGVFGRYPDQWEWAAVVLAGVGLVMSAPTVLQMLWGRALVLADFERAVKGTERCLLVFLRNPPIDNRLLKHLGVRRDTVQSLVANFRITQLNSGAVAVPNRQARIYTDEDLDDTGRSRVPLPPTFSVGATIGVARWDSDGARTVVPADRLRPEEEELKPGYYRAEIILLIDGEPQNEARNFVVGKEADDLIWTP